MRIHDVSWPITSRMTTYKDRNDVRIESQITTSPDTVHESTITMHTHTGTHIDAPLHFIPDGISIDQLSLQQLIGPTMVIDVADVEVIDKKVLENYEIKKDHLVFFKTRNSLLPADAPFKKDFVYVTPDGAELLIQKKVRAVGIDYLGIERGDALHTTHKLLLSANIPIIEGLRLKNITPGIYYGICLPLALIGVDAAPARCILIEDKEW